MINEDAKSSSAEHVQRREHSGEVQYSTALLLAMQHW